MQQIQKLFEFIAFSSEAKQHHGKTASSGHTNTHTTLTLTHTQQGWVVMTQNIAQK